MRIVCILTALNFAATATAAETAQLTCKFNRGHTSTLPTSVFATVNYDTGTAKVGIPGSSETSSADISEDSSARLSLAWEELVPDRRGTYAKLAFRLVHFKKNGRGLLRVDAVGFDNQYTARGGCQMVN